MHFHGLLSTLAELVNKYKEKDECQEEDDPRYNDWLPDGIFFADWRDFTIGTKWSTSDTAAVISIAVEAFAIIDIIRTASILCILLLHIVIISWEKINADDNKAS